MELQDKAFKKNMPNPTEEDLKDENFKVIWNTIKSWDVKVPDYYDGYCGASGSHVMLIINELRKSKLTKELL